MTTSRKKEDFFFKVANNQYAKLNLRKASFSSGLLTAMGAVAELPDTGNVVATGKEDALSRGVFYLNIYYAGPSGKQQSAKIPVAPEKSDTAFADFRNHKYRGKAIENVRVPRRRIYTV